MEAKRGFDQYLQLGDLHYFFFIVQGCVPEKVCSVERQGHVRHVLTMNPVDWYVLWNLE